MSDSPKKLREDRNVIAKEIRTLADLANNEKREFTAEENEKWVRINGDYDALSKRIEVAERADSIDGEQKRDAGDNRVDKVHGGERRDGGDGAAEVTEEHRALALQAWCRSQFDIDLTEQHRDACERVGFDPNRRKLDIHLPSTRQANDFRRQFRDAHPSKRHEVRALSGVQASTGATFIPEGFVNQLEVNMLAFGGMRQVAETIRTATGAPMPWPTVSDTSNKGRRIGENTAVATNVEPSTGQKVWYAHKYTSDAILVPTELMEDSAFDLVSLLGQMLGERLGRITNQEFTLGTGNGQPKGLVPASTLGKTTTGATAITADEVIDLLHSVDPAYRTGAGFMMHDGIVLYLRKLKDGSGRYLWSSGLQAGVADTILGHTLTVNQDMQASVATGTKTMLFGQLSNYKIRTVGSIRIYRLEERYRDNDQDGFMAFIREDGNLVEAGTPPVKHLLQA